jgi:hypothetical protein
LLCSYFKEHYSLAYRRVHPNIYFLQLVQALKELKAKAAGKGAFGGAGLKKSGGAGKK